MLRADLDAAQKREMDRRLGRLRADLDAAQKREMDRRVGGPQSRSGRCVEKRNG
jgi:hypothetical protein